MKSTFNNFWYSPHFLNLKNEHFNAVPLCKPLRNAEAEIDAITEK